ncbi:hypothetical protein RHGRI_012172 [Rhododendron griersonianum]|uniref:BUB1 N-terminal domain-containing protein n=1 Tax=Rhododendron griersonianum TaxID=479676 RepID=A0AAV6KPG0_9ERIC|nr:hypothetical protein RHGRI_012172 [Rhododendron griersonianum]
MEFQVVWDFTDDDPVGGVLLRRSLCISIADLFMHRLIKQSFDALNSSDHGGTDLDELISNCIRTFKTDKRYQNDVRFLKIWFLHMDASPDFESVFREMVHNQMCVNNSMLYESYALFLEANGKLTDALVV